MTNQQVIFENNRVYSDLALDAHSLAVEQTGGEVQGVSVQEEQLENALITRIEVMNEQGAKAIGKPIGKYITIESDGLKGQNRMVHDQLSEIFAGELASLANLENIRPHPNLEPTIFIVGLGNWNATPDALGPQVLNHLMVTRHLYQEAPPELRKGLRPVCALSPGVLGLTGVQTAEIIKGVVEMVQPNLIIAIDALSARSTARLANTIQISNTGIAPGSGLGKNRMAINQETMNIPVIAIGVPTVVHAITIVNDAMEELLKGNIFSPAERERFRHIDEAEKKRTIGNILGPYMGSLVVSPKGVDELILDLGRIIAGGINVALHPDITPDNLSLYL
ncbi:GPR endopeptidase [Iocasia frigidifontis]|uniref:Germination protease n=1 Tax=Iocasia fonsfrigidae TaxID=2682810 RepID=A0A8A7KER1_9FIRM|nr:MULTISPECIES: GPR endopeptidase [Halanaerobiaceae]AZO94993.1 GPR endopeptidase [Halocella sp. SP3-1]MTI61266.1 GPR endopeptidase [Bacillota bacterium]QTL97949.1 GPR endopeptidase [Iocasia fonsfrigidae]